MCNNNNNNIPTVAQARLPPHMELLTEEAKPEEDPQKFSRLASEREPGATFRKSEIKCDASKGPLESQLCVICCDRVPDAVLLPCGHGGLCFQCGRKLCKQGCCYLCRQVPFLEECDLCRISGRSFSLNYSRITRPILSASSGCMALCGPRLVRGIILYLLTNWI